MAARSVFFMLSLGLALMCGCRNDSAELSDTRGAGPQPAAAPLPEPMPLPEPEPDPVVKPTVPEEPLRPLPKASALEPEPEPVDERPEWQKIIDSQEPGMLMARKRPPEGASAKPAASAATASDSTTPKPDKPAAKAEQPAAAAPSGKGKTYCTWQYYASIQFLCTDLEPDVAKAKCDAKESAALGEAVSCTCVPAEGYAPQCLD